MGPGRPGGYQIAGLFQIASGIGPAQMILQIEPMRVPPVCGQIVYQATGVRVTETPMSTSRLCRLLAAESYELGRWR